MIGAPGVVVVSTKILALYTPGDSAVLRFAVTVPGVVPVALVSVNQLAPELTVAAYACDKFVVSVEVTLTWGDAGAAPFWVAETENPLSGLAVSPAAVMVPLSATRPDSPRIV